MTTKTLQFLVQVDVEVPDGAEVYESDIGSGIQMGIQYMIDAGELGGNINKHIGIGEVSTNYQPVDLLEALALLKVACHALETPGDFSPEELQTQVIGDISSFLAAIEE
jgi:hypothetical protein